MKIYYAALAAILSLASPANARTVIFDNFDTEAGGQTLDRYNSFNNFEVQIGAVDLVRQPGIKNLACPAGSGSCVGLIADSGSEPLSRLRTRNFFSFNSGDLIKLTFDVAGKQPPIFGSSFISGGFDLAGDANGGVNVLNFIANVGFGDINIGSFNNSGGTNLTVQFDSNTPLSQYSYRFTAGSAGFVKAYAGALGNPQFGPLLDNFRLEIIGNAVPEPASWAMMLLGFGLIGSALRKCRPALPINLQAFYG
jgi:PEP-CTERM motif